MARAGRRAVTTRREHGVSHFGWSLCVPALALALAGCGTNASGGGDSGFDAGATDSGALNDGGAPDAGAPDAGRPDGGDAGNLDAGAPLTAPLETWTWVPFPDTHCANGTPDGLVVNLTNKSDDLLVYISGGGLCWDGPTCFEAKLSVHVEDTFGDAGIGPLAEARGHENTGLFDRKNPTNVFRNANYVYIPYCTGDLHGGRAKRTYTRSDGGVQDVWHWGAPNFEAFLARLRPTFPAPTRMWLTGSSAGGFGSFFNFPRFVQAFPNSDVAVLGDAAPMVTPDGGRWPVWRTVWNLELPPSCANCATELGAYIDSIADAYPTHRIGYTGYDTDLIVSLYWGYAYGQLPVRQMVNQHWLGHANTRAMVVPGLLHVFFDQTTYNDLRPDGGPNPSLLYSSDGGISAREWIRRWALGDGGWSTTL